MTPLCPTLVIATANELVGFVAKRDRPDARVNTVLREVRWRPDAPWSAAFVHHIGYWAHASADERSSSWPLPATGDCHHLALFAREHRILHEEPLYGDVFLKWCTREQAFVHAGFVGAVRRCGPARGAPAECFTIEGDVDRDGEPGGGEVRALKRSLAGSRGDRFVRWAALDPREAIDRSTFHRVMHMGRMIPTRPR